MTMRILLAAAILLSASATSSGQRQTGGARSFTIGAPLSSGGEGWESAVAIDGSGTSVAVWDERTTNGLVTDKIWTKARPANGTWGPKAVLSGSLQTTYVYPAVRASRSNGATAIWSDVDGLWTADRSAAAVWGASQLLLPGVSSTLFVMNSLGDEALLWGSGGGRSGATQLNALRRAAGAAWGRPEMVASGTAVGLNHAALADNGDLVVTWETFTAQCGERCTFSNFVLHAAREAKGTSLWDDSGPLTGSDAVGHNAFVAADAKGRAVAVYFSAGNTLSAMTQAALGAQWTPSAMVYSGSSVVVAGLSADVNGNATLGLEDFGAGAVIAIGGSTVTNIWSAPVTVSGKDPSPTQVIFAGGNGGAAVMAWAAGNPGYTNDVIRVAIRPNATGAWRAPQTISPPGVQMASPESIAVNATGKAVVLFSAFTPSLVHTEYASTF